MSKIKDPNKKPASKRERKKKVEPPIENPIIKVISSDSELPFNAGKVVETLREEARLKSIKPAKESKAVAKTFLQINKSNLLTYFTFGLIYPNNLETREIVREKTRQKDTQSVYPDFLVLSEGRIDLVNDDQLFLDIQLTDSEKQELISLGDALLFSKPLPISRVEKIYVSSIKVKENILSTSEVFPDAFIPESLFQIYNENSLKQASFKLDANYEPNAEKDDLILRKQRFDRILGMLAFMKNTELYYANSSNKFSDYSNFYFLTLHLLNKEFELSDKFNVKESTINVFNTLLQKPSRQKGDLLEAIVKKIYNNEVFDKKTVSMFFSYGQNYNISPQLVSVLQEALSSLFDYGFTDALNKLESQSELWSYYALAVLSKYHKKASSDKEALKKGFGEKVKENYAEIILALLGLYYGYASLPKQEEINLTDPFFKSLIPKIHNIKFRLGNNLDKLIVESVYQFCFNQQPDYAFFAQLRKQTKFTSSLLELPKRGENTYQQDSFVFEDVLVRKIESLSKSDSLVMEINRQYPENIKATSFLSIYILRYLLLSNPFEIDTNGFPSFKINRDKLVKALKSTNIKNISMLEFCIKADKEFSE